MGNTLKPIDGTNHILNGIHMTNDGFIANGDLHIKYFEFWDSLLDKYDTEMNVDVDKTVNGQLFKGNHLGK